MMTTIGAPVKTRRAADLVPTLQLGDPDRGLHRYSEVRWSVDLASLRREWSAGDAANRMRFIELELVARAESKHRHADFQ